MYKRLLITLSITLTTLALTYRPALAHDGEPHPEAGWWSAWSLDPWVLGLLGVMLVIYLRGWQTMQRRTGAASAPMRRRAWVFGAGVTALLVAMVSPVDALAGQLFWVHMLQHSLLMLVVAPLLALAAPLPQMLLGLPQNARKTIGRGWQRMDWLRGLWKTISSPLAAWLLQAVLLWGWHSPVLYQASVENDVVHAVQHFSFLGSALLFWWVTLHTFGPRSAYRGAGVIYLFTTAMHSGLLGALLTFSTRLWYPVYSGRAETWGMSALADQQLAGTVMWVPGGIVYLVAALWLMKSWLDAMESGEEVALRKEL